MTVRLVELIIINKVSLTIHTSGVESYSSMEASQLVEVEPYEEIVGS